jgi:mannose-6-phosphate isomerase-like protein (cupin superfamily)
MKAQFNEIYTSPENSIFKVVFFPDRIYHAQYLNATRSERYRYNVQEVRAIVDVIVLKGEVYLDGAFLCNFLRIEYRASRLVEQSRERGRLLRGELLAWVKLMPQGGADLAREARVKLHYDNWVDAFQVELWGTLEAPVNKSHNYSVLDMMGRNRPITRVPAFADALRDVKAIKQVALAFRENDRDLPAGYFISEENTGWDNNFARSHQEPRTNEPSSSQNTVEDGNYLLDFQRGWYLQASDVPPVRYRNAMMEAARNPDAANDNIIEMRWILQREFGGSVVFFHEVMIPPGKVEGTHQHIGSEELYYITEGEGLAYLRVGDDPRTDSFPTVEREVFGIGRRQFKELPVKAGSVIFTKSGGMHGIRNPGAVPLKFVAFLYHQ